MKTISTWFVVLAIFGAAPPAMADSASAAKTFIHGLDEADANCTATYRLALLNQKLHAMNGTATDEKATETELERDSNADITCREEAKNNAEQLYRSFVGSTRSPRLKADAKKVLAAWLTFLNRGIGEEPNRHVPEVTNYIQAKSELEADSMKP